MQKTSRRPAKILAIILCVLVVLLIVCGVVIWLGVSKIWEKPDVEPNTGEEYEADPEASGLPEVTYVGGEVEQIEKIEGVVDILLIGVDDRRVGKFSGRSDVMIYLRIDNNNNSLKLASFMRDTLVPIEGHSKNKLNTAFSYDGIDLTKKTFKANFGMAPDYYIIVNFFGMEDIINGLGGVDIDIKSNELESMNSSIKEINGIDKGKDSDTIKSAGRQHLNGRQAVAYMRTRHPGGDQGRIERQQTVLSALFKKAKDVSLGQLPGLAGAMIQYVRTDIPLDKMIDIAGAIKGMEGEELNKFRYPDEYKGGSYKKMSIVQPKVFEEEIKKLHDFLNN
jgi:LCP family protein required for cell wall assembly